MRVIIAGSRTIKDPAVVNAAVRDSGFTVTEVVSGAARGVDTLGEWWGLFHGIPVKPFYPRWDELGKRAGFVRNLEMAEYAEALVAISSQNSPGTAHMIKAARKRGLKVFVVEV